MGRFTQLVKKAEDYAAAEGVRISKPFPRKLGLVAWAIAVILVVLIVGWMAYHP